MGHHFELSDEDLERLLSGKAPAGDGTHEDLVSFVRGVQTSYLVTPSEEVTDRHLSAILEASRLVTDKGDPAVRPASKANGPAPQASGLPKWRRKAVFSSLFASLTVKIAGAALAATTATGALAATGNLPAPAQAVVASAAERVGITVPSGQGASGDHRKDGDHADKRVDADVRKAAQDSTLKGRDKGAAVSDAADKNRKDGTHPTGEVPTSTVTANPTGYGNPTVPTENPTGFGPSSQPTENPTGFGSPTTPGGRP